ncbi:TPA: hypothetical protein ACF7M5_004131 [Salmonella enterica]
MKTVCTKYNTLVLLLTGILTCFSAAASPVEATGILHVKDETSISHTLIPVKTQLNEGIIPANLLLAQGTFKSSKSLAVVRLSWLRSVNPALNDTVQNAGIAKLQNSDMPDCYIPVIISQETESDLMSNKDSLYYWLDDTTSTTFRYKITTRDSGYLKPGQYLMAIESEVYGA